MKDKYLKCNLMGSTLCFNKIVKQQGSVTFLDNGNFVCFRDNQYFKQIKKWERIAYTLFNSKEECIDYIKNNFEIEKDFNLFKNIDEALNQECFRK